MNFKFLAVSVLCSQVLAACGGGGSSTNAGASAAAPMAVAAVSDPSTPTIAVDATITDLYAAPHNFDRTETDPGTGNVYIALADFSVGPDTTIEGTGVKSASVRRALIKNGVVIQGSSEISYFQTAPYKLIATQSLDSPLYQVVSGQSTLPTEGRAGQSGPFYNATFYDSPAKKTVVSTSTYTWQILADTATTLTFCINSTTTFPNVPGTFTNADCYKVNAPDGVNPTVVTGVRFIAPK